LKIGKRLQYYSSVGPTSSEEVSAHPLPVLLRTYREDECDAAMIMTV